MKRIGTQRKLGDDERTRMLAALKWWRDKAAQYFPQRTAFERRFYNVWSNQNPSGRLLDDEKHAAFPFHGASDQRVWWGKRILDELMATLVNAVAAADVEVRCGAGGDADKRASAIKTLIEWEKRKMGSDWQRELRVLFHHMLLDTPAVGMMDVDWRKTRTAGVVSLTVDEARAEFGAYLQESGSSGSSGSGGFGGDDGTGGEETDPAAIFDGCLDNPQEGDAVQAWLMGEKGAAHNAAARIEAALAEDGECEFLGTVREDEGPRMTALRYGDDFVIPVLTTRFADVDLMFRHEWMTEAQLRSLAGIDGWDPQWLEDELKYDGAAFYDLQEMVPNDDRKGMYDIAYFYTTETDARGVVTRWVTVMGHADGSAFGKRIVRSRRGDWSSVFFSREVDGRDLMDVSGIEESAVPAQGIGKAVADGIANNALVGSQPFIRAKGTNIKDIVFEPFATVHMKASEDVSYGQPPVFPATGMQLWDKFKAELMDVCGVTDGKTDVSNRTQAFVGWFLIQMQDLYTRLVVAAQDYASDECLARVTGDGDVTGLRRESITGEFGITLTLDANDLNYKTFLEKAQGVSQVLLGLDKGNVVDTNPIVNALMRRFFPELANRALKDSGEVAADDVKAEQQNFVLIKAGVMPQMDTKGRWNFGARIQFYQDLMNKNPQAIAQMTPESQQMLADWLKALKQQDQQYGANAELGKTGSANVPALEA